MAANIYKCEGKRVPSVTTIISNCKIGGIEPLMYWANQCGLAGKNHREEKDKAADAGTCAHEMIECDIKEKEFDSSKYLPHTIALAESSFRGYQEWKDQVGLKLVESEIMLVSYEYRYGGQIDCASTNNGKLLMLDWKTSNHVYPDYLIQLAAYKHLWDENYPENPITGGLGLLRVSRQKEPDDPTQFAYHYWENIDLAFETFLMMRKIYDMNKTLKRMC